MSSPIVVTLGTLTTATATSFQALGPQDNFVFQVTAASVTADVTIRFEGSLDATNWFNLAGSDTTINANSTTGYAFSQRPVPFVRASVITIASGTPSLVFKLALSTAL